MTGADRLVVSWVERLLRLIKVLDCRPIDSIDSNARNMEVGQEPELGSVAAEKQHTIILGDEGKLRPPRLNAEHRVRWHRISHHKRAPKCSLVCNVSSIRPAKQ